MNGGNRGSTSRSPLASYSQTNRRFNNINNYFLEDINYVNLSSPTSWKMKGKVKHQDHDDVFLVQDDDMRLSPYLQQHEEDGSRAREDPYLRGGGRGGARTPTAAAVPKTPKTSRKPSKTPATLNKASSMLNPPSPRGSSKSSIASPTLSSSSLSSSVSSSSSWTRTTPSPNSSPTTSNTSKALWHRLTGTRRYKDTFSTSTSLLYCFQKQVRNSDSSAVWSSSSEASDSTRTENLNQHASTSTNTGTIFAPSCSSSRSTLVSTSRSPTNNRHGGAAFGAQKPLTPTSSSTCFNTTSSGTGSTRTQGSSTSRGLTSSQAVTLDSAGALPFCTEFRKERGGSMSSSTSVEQHQVAQTKRSMKAQHKHATTTTILDEGSSTREATESMTVDTPTPRSESGTPTSLVSGFSHSATTDKSIGLDFLLTEEEYDYERTHNTTSFTQYMMSTLLNYREK
ncbi:unnamed protein product [Amoebophrya sp. A25]|nr:unnamed protein product [Amoebophrya sp. A25]|eukprot:GSA25T00003502001.1